MDINNEAESIKKYIYIKFEDILENEEKQDKINNNNDEVKDSISVKNNQFEKVASGIENIINNKRQSILVQSYHESRIEQEIGKCDLGGNGEEDILEKNYKFLRIMDIKRNENFGTTYMLLNKPSALSLRVISKKADLFILRKHDVINISKAYPSIWNKIRKNAMFNMIAIKKKTLSTLRNYCSSHGIKLDSTKPKKSQRIDPINLFEIKELMEIEKLKQEEENLVKGKSKSIKEKAKKAKSITKRRKEKSQTQILNQKDFINNVKSKLINKYSGGNSNLKLLKTLVNNKISCELNNYKTMRFQHELNNFKIESNFSKRTKSKLIPSIIKENDDEEKNIGQMKNYDSSYKARKQDEIKNLKELVNNEEDKNKKLKNSIILDNKSNDTDKIYINEEDKLYPNTLSNFQPDFASFLKKKIFRKQHKSKKYYKLMCLKLIDLLKNNKTTLYKNNNKINQKINNDNINNNNLSNNIKFKNKNKDLISNSNIISDLNKNNDLLSSVSDIEQSTIFEEDKLSISKNNSFIIKSIYNNLNQVSNGKYGKNQRMQKDIQEYVKFYQNNNNFDLIKNSRTISKINKKSNKENSFLELLGNLSEIKSFSDNNSEKNDINPLMKSEQSKCLIKHSSIKKSRNGAKNSVKLAQKFIESSETKRNKNLKGKENKEFNYERKKSKTFIKSIFKNNINDKNKIENCNKSQSRDSLNELSRINLEIGLRNINFEEVKERTLNKLQANIEKNSNKQKIKEKKNNNIGDEKIHSNCYIF